MFIVRLIFLVSFPHEISYAGFSDYLSSSRIFFILGYSFFTMLFVTAFFLILIGYSLKLDYRLIYLRIIFFILFIVFISDFFLSLLIYTKVNLTLFFQSNAISGYITHFDFKTNNIIIVIISIFIIGYSVFYTLLKKNYRRYIIIGYNILFIVTFFILLSVLWYRLSYFFGLQSLLYSAMELFKYNNWFIGWLILFIIFSGFSAYLVSVIMMVLRYKFLHFNFGMHYILEFNRISLMSVYGLGVICLLPDILMYWFK